MKSVATTIKPSLDKKVNILKVFLGRMRRGRQSAPHLNQTFTFLIDLSPKMLTFKAYKGILFGFQPLSRVSPNILIGLTKTTK